MRRLAQGCSQNIPLFNLSQPQFQLFKLFFVFFHFRKDEILVFSFVLYFFKEVVALFDQFLIFFIPGVKECFIDSLFLKLIQSFAINEQTLTLEPFNIFHKFLEIIHPLI